MKLKKTMSWLFSMSMVVTSLTIPNVHAAEYQNLALKKPTTDSAHYDNWTGSLATDGDLSTRWSTENAEHAGTNHYITVDLEKATKLTDFEMYFEVPKNDSGNKQRVRKYKIEGSKDNKTFELLYQSADKPEGYGYEDKVSIQNDKEYQYVRLTIESLKEGAYPSISVREFKVFNKSKDPVNPDKPTTPVDINLAKGKTAKAQSSYTGFGPEKLTDGNYDVKTGRWSTEAAPPKWFYIDLGQSETMNHFKATWESGTVYPSAYKIYVSDNTENWGNPVVDINNHKGEISNDYLKEAVTGRYVKVEVSKMEGYQNVSCREFEVFNATKKPQTPQDPEMNVALNKKATADGNEASNLDASKAVDGIKDNNSRWSSPNNHNKHWLSVDLGETFDVRTVRLIWETQKAKNYEIQYTNDETVDSNTQWKTFKAFSDHPSSTKQTVTLDNAVQARHVRVLINEFTDKDPGGKAEWATISIYELEVYGGIPQNTVDEVLDEITVAPIKKGDKEVHVNLPPIKGYVVIYNGADYEQIVDDNLNIITPVVSQKVKLSFKATNINDKKDRYFKEVEVTIPGEFEVAKEDNKAPVILPELREWKGHTGNFIYSPGGRIVINNSALTSMAQSFQADLKDVTGKELTIVENAEPKTGDFVFKLKDSKRGLGEEGYYMTISDHVVVEAEDQTGAFWSTRTLLQALKQTNYKTIPQGIARDYPLYRVRGFILDVGRKTFTMNQLEQLMKQMSYYKLNDFHVHLNDNLIPLEHYDKQGNEAIMNAYSGFRLESDIKKGGNGGKNKADLTSKDVFYTKEQFRNFISEARVRGVNIVPEIDVPAHSLALTRVRPDLRHGTSGRQNDHLNLTTKYDDSVKFVKSIFDEYIDGSNPVFDGQTTVHFGADEYSADGNAYRKFVNDMIGYLKGKDRQPRVWGSLTTIKGSTKVNGEGVEMNVWNSDWADAGDMYDKGFDLINCLDGRYYIVPNAGYYYDYLNAGTMYNEDINTMVNDYIPAGDPQMAGASFAVWNDMCDYLNNGITEWDVFDRANESLPLFAAKLWGKPEQAMSLEKAQQVQSALGDAPLTNFHYNVEAKNGVYEHIDNESALNNVNAPQTTVDYKKVTELKGGKSYIQTKLNKTIGMNTSLKFKVKRTSNDVSQDQILFESNYGKIIGVQKNTGKLAINRENFTIVFDYQLPINEWVELEIRNTSTGKNNENFVDLYVNGQLVSRMGDDERAAEGKKLIATTMIPFERIGSQTNAFVGYIDDIKVTQLGKPSASVDKTSTQTMLLDYAMSEAQYILNDKASLTQEQRNQLTDLIKQGQELTIQVKPDQKEVDRITAQIRAILKDVEYKKADYSEIEALLATIPSQNLLKRYYTQASIESLNKVIASIRYDLPIAMQDTVDAYAKALRKAIDHLEKLDGALSDDNYYNGHMKATASSHQDGSSAPDKAIDKDNNTMWHSKWSITTMPHWFQIELDTVQKVDGLYYLPRQSGDNGTCSKYEIWVGTSKDSMKKVKEGTLEVNSDAKVISFEPTDAKFVKMVYKDAKNKNGSAAEFKVHIAPGKADKQYLEALYNEASKIDLEPYTQASKDALLAALKQAKAILDDPQNTDYHACIKAENALIDALKGLVIASNSELPTVDFSKLEALIEKASTYQAKDYTKESFKRLETALNAAKAILNNDNVTQEQVDAVTKALDEAIKGLVKIESQGSQNQTTTPNSNNQQNAQQNKPSTGDQTVVSTFVATLGLACAGMYLTMKKRKED